MAELTDEQLVEKYITSGNHEFLELLIQRYLSPLYNFVFKYTHSESEAEDVTQESFVKIWKNITKFNAQYKFKTWAYTIAKNTALDSLKKKGLVPLEDTQESVDRALFTYQVLPEAAIKQSEDMALIARNLASLNPKYQNVISLYYFFGLNFREIAEKLGQSIDTVKTRHRRAIFQLKKAIAERP